MYNQIHFIYKQLFKLILATFYLIQYTKQERILFKQEIIQNVVVEADYEGWEVDGSPITSTYIKTCNFPGKFVANLNENTLTKSYTDLPIHFKIEFEFEMSFYGAFLSFPSCSYYQGCRNSSNNGYYSAFSGQCKTGKGSSGTWEDGDGDKYSDTQCSLTSANSIGQVNISADGTQLHEIDDIKYNQGSEEFCPNDSNDSYGKYMSVRKITLNELHSDPSFNLQISCPRNWYDNRRQAMWGIYNIRIFTHNCHQSCKTCSDAISCDTCIDGATSLGVGKLCLCDGNKNIENGVCVEKCSKGFWPDGETFVCSKKEGQLSNIIDAFNDNAFTDSQVFTSDPAFVASDITMCGVDKIMGGYQKYQDTKLNYLDITIDDHSKIRIQASLYKIDNWDNNTFKILSNGQQELYSITLGTSSTSDICGDPAQNDEIIYIDTIVEHFGFRVDLTFETDIVAGSSGYWGIRDIYVDILAYQIGCYIGSMYEDDECTVCKEPYLIYQGKCYTECPIYTVEASGTCNDEEVSSYYYPYTAYLGMFDDYFSSSLLYELGWNINQTGVSEKSSYTTQCGDKTILGGLGVGSDQTNLEYTFTGLPSHYKAVIRYTLYLIDGWTTADKLVVQIDGSNITKKIIGATTTYQDVSTILKTDLTCQPSICGLSGDECIGEMTHMIESHTSEEMVVNFRVISGTSSGQNGGTYYLSAGIRNLNIVLESCQYLTCALCIDNDGCQNCKLPYYLNPLNKECQLCQPGEYVHSGLYTPYYDGLCLACPHECSTCTNEDPPVCEVCKDIRENLPTCNCPHQYYNDPALDPCQNCDARCDGCTISGCDACQENRILDAGLNCGCVDVDGVYDDHYPYSLVCSTCSVAVLKIYYNSDFTAVYMDLDGVSVFKINGVPNEDLYKPKESTCGYLFPQEILDIIGAGYKCSVLESDHTVIEIQLGFRSQVYPGQELYFKPDSVQRSDCGSVYYSIFDSNTLTLSENQAVPIVDLVGPVINNSICEEKVLYVSRVYNDANFGLKTFEWVIDDVFPVSGAERVRIQYDLLQEINDEQVQAITIPPGFLQPYTEYTITINFETYLTTTGSSSYLIKTGGNESALLQFPYSTVPQFYRWEKITLKANLYHIQCSNTDDLQQIYGDVYVAWDQITGKRENLNATQVFEKIPAIESSITIDPFKAHYNSDTQGEYVLSVTISLLTAPFTYSRNLTFNVIPSPLHAEIVGGSRLAYIKQEHLIEGITKDYDWDTSDPVYNATYGIQYRWDCFDLNDDFNPCVDRFGEALYMDSLNVTIPANSMLSYNAYQFTLNLTTGNVKANNFRTYETSEVVIFQEMEIPYIRVYHDDYTHLRRNEINLNDVIYATIENDKRFENLNDVMYNVDFVYNYKTVGSLKSTVQDIQYKIWDKFIDFQSTPNITLKYSVYHSNYLMPSQSSFKVMTNLGPYLCNINLQVGTGYALKTEFKVIVQGCLDQEQPFSYRFYLYDSMELYELEKEFKEARKGLILNEYQQDNKLEMILPQGLEENGYDQILMVSVIDKQGGIVNQTTTIHVEPYQATTSQQYLDYVQEQLDIVEFNFLEDKIYQLVKFIIDYKRNPVLEEGEQFDSIRLQIFQKLFTYQKYVPSSSDLDAYVLWALSQFKEDFSLFYGDLDYQYKIFYVHQFGLMQDILINKLVNQTTYQLTRNQIKDFEKNQQGQTSILDIISQFLMFTKYDPNEENIIKEKPDGETDENQDTKLKINKILQQYQQDKLFTIKKQIYDQVQYNQYEQQYNNQYGQRILVEAEPLNMQTVELEPWYLSTYEEKDLMNKVLLNYTIFSQKALLMHKEVNTAPLLYVNDFLLIVSNRVTYDKIHQYIDGGIKNEQVEIFTQDLPDKDYLQFPTGEDVSNNYQVIILKYTQNHPYQYDKNFPYPQQEYPMVVPFIFHEQHNITTTLNNTENIYISQTIKHKFVGPPLIEKVIDVLDEKTGENQQFTVTIRRYCVQQIPDPQAQDQFIWDITSCGQKRTILENGNIEFQCICSTLKPVVLLDDFNYKWGNPLSTPIPEPIPLPQFGQYYSYRPWHDVEIFEIVMILTFFCGLFIPWGISRDKFDKYIYSFQKKQFLESQKYISKDEKVSLLHQLKKEYDNKNYDQLLSMSANQLNNENKQQVKSNFQKPKYQELGIQSQKMPKLFGMSNNRYKRGEPKPEKPQIIELNNYDDEQNIKNLQKRGTLEQLDLTQNGFKVSSEKKLKNSLIVSQTQTPRKPREEVVDEMGNTKNQMVTLQQETVTDLNMVDSQTKLNLQIQQQKNSMGGSKKINKNQKLPPISSNPKKNQNLNINLNQKQINNQFLKQKQIDSNSQENHQKSKATLYDLEKEIPSALASSFNGEDKEISDSSDKQKYNDTQLALLQIHELSPEQKKEQMKKMLLYSAIAYHKFFSIFLIYDTNLPRFVKLVQFYFENIAIVVIARALQMHEKLDDSSINIFAVLILVGIQIVGDMIRFTQRIPILRYFVMILIIISGTIAGWVFVIQYSQSIRREDSWEWPAFYIQLALIDNLVISIVNSLIKTALLICSYKKGITENRTKLQQYIFSSVNQPGVLHFWVGFLSLNK